MTEEEAIGKERKGLQRNRRRAFVWHIDEATRLVVVDRKEERIF